MLSNTKAYQKLRHIKWKFRNYFSDQGLFTRKLRHSFAKHDPLVQAKLRKKIYLSLKRNNVQQRIQDAVEELNTKGYVFLKFQDLGISSDAVYEFYDKIIKNFNENKDDPTYLQTLDQGVYAGKTISYRLYEKKGARDPLVDLTQHDNLIKIATLYLQYLPVIEEMSLVYNPIHKDKQFGSQLWHCDTQQKRILKLFFSPMEITKENGPFEFFPPNLSSTQFYKLLPEGMTDKQLESFGLDLNCAIKFLAKRDEILLVDTVRCLHRGGVTQRPRFISTISYSSPLYSFTRKKYRQTGTFKFSFVTYQKENEKLVNDYASKF